MPDESRAKLGALVLPPNIAEVKWQTHGKDYRAKVGVELVAPSSIWQKSEHFPMAELRRNGLVGAVVPGSNMGLSASAVLDEYLSYY